MKFEKEMKFWGLFINGEIVSVNRSLIRPTIDTFGLRPELVMAATSVEVKEVTVKPV